MKPKAKQNLRRAKPPTAVDFFAERAARANVEEALEIMSREGGEPPRAGDEMPQLGAR